MLRKELKAAHSAILISFDLWTSPNSYAILSIITYFINKDGKCHYVVLGLHEIVSEHTNKNITAILVALFKDYKITSNIRFFMVDNAKSNDTCINTVF